MFEIRKRGWVAISIDILESGLDPLSKTGLMYKSNLNYVRFQRYFNNFLEKGLLEEARNKYGRTKVYVTSERGKTLLKALQEAERIFSEILVH